MTNSQYWREREAEYIAEAKRCERIPEDAQKAAEARDMRAWAADAARRAEEAEAEERAEAEALAENARQSAQNAPESKSNEERGESPMKIKNIENITKSEQKKAIRYFEKKHPGSEVIASVWATNRRSESDIETGFQTVSVELWNEEERESYTVYLAVCLWDRRRSFVMENAENWYREPAEEATTNTTNKNEEEKTMNTNTANKKSISVSNLTLDLYLNYVRPAAIRAGILEDAVTEEGRPYHITEEAIANEIESCMRCACFNSNNDYAPQRTHEEYIANEADQMLYQLEVSIKYSKDSKVTEALQTLRDVMTAEIERAKAEKMVEAIAEKVEQAKTSSAWERGVKAYAEELVEELREAVEGGYVDADELSNRRLLEKAMLNGASDWKQYSEGGCSLCYDGQIAERLCAPWELRKTDNGRKDPNPSESWIDVQSRALYQAAQMILRVAF